MNEFQLIVQQMLLSARAKMEGGLTLAEIGQLWNEFIEKLVQAASKYLVDLTGPEKKAAVLAAVGQLYDLLAPLVPLPWFLAWGGAWIRPWLRKLVMLLAGGMVEAIYQTLVRYSALEG